MKQVILNIPEQQYEFFMQLVSKLGFHAEAEFDISEEDKSIVRDRITNTKSKDLISWSEAKNKLNF